MKFYLVICKDKFFLYNEKRESVHLEGNPFFKYESNKIREASIRLIETLIDENNLSSKDELQFEVIENSDKVRNGGVAKELGNLIVKSHSINDLMPKTVSALAKNPKLYIKELGVNYDGECYHFDEPMWRSDYSLTALSIDPSEVMKFVN